MNAEYQVFKGEDRVAMTPCMVAFEKWWAKNSRRYPQLGMPLAWDLFRNGWWANDEQDE